LKATSERNEPELQEPVLVEMRPGDPSRLPDWRRMEVDELPAPIPPNKHSGPVTLVIHLSVLVLPFGGGATGHDGRIKTPRRMR